MAHIQKIERKKGTVYRIRVGNGYDINGTQKMASMNWKVPDGLTPKQEEKELARIVVDFERKVEEGQIHDNIKFAEFADRWLEYAKKNRSPKYVSESERLLAVVNTEIGHIPLAKLKKQHIQDFYNKLTDEVRIIKKKTKDAEGNVVIDEIEKKKAPATIIRYHRLISTVLTKAVQWDVISNNICLGRGLEMPKNKRYDVKYLEDDEAVKFLEMLSKEPTQYRVFFTLALYTGFRNGELLGLEWSDIDFENCLISVKRSSQYIAGVGIFTKETKNTTSDRTIQVIPDLIAMLKQYKAWKNEERLSVGPLWKANPENTDEKYCANGYNCSKNDKKIYCKKCSKCKDFYDPDRLFTQANGLPMHLETPRKWLQKFTTRNGLKDFTVHSLRHTNISLMIMQGVPLPTVAKMAGHSSTATTTRIYSHSIKTAEQMAIEKVANILKPNKEAK